MTIIAPQNVQASQADGNILVTWTPPLNAAGYLLQTCNDGINFTTKQALSAVSQYLDPLPAMGLMWYYRLIAQDGSGNLSLPSSYAQMAAAPPSEMSLYELRLRAQQTADRVNSNFVTTTEWNAFLRLAEYELYDLLVTNYEDLFSSSQAFIQTNGTVANYPLPDGYSNYLGGVYGGTSGAPAPALYKLVGMDLGVNTSNNAWVTLPKFNFVDRNKFVYPNSTSTIYGVYNMRYRMMGNYFNLIPTPSGNQQIRIWYCPKLKALLSDTDVTTLGYSGWLRYTIVRAAKYALNKEESNTDHLDAELLFLKERIVESSANRDIGMPDTISNTRQDSVYGGNGSGGGWSNAGW